MSSKPVKLKPLPELKSDAEAEIFVGNADLTKYDLSGFKPASFEFQKKTAQVNLRMSRDLLDTIKARAKDRGIPYQRLIREALEKELAG